LVKADVHPIIAVAGKGGDFVRGLLDEGKGDRVVDYREGDEKVKEGIKAAVPKGGKLGFAFDAVSEKGSSGNIAAVLDTEGGRVTTVLPGKEHPEFTEGQVVSLTTVGSVHGVPDDLRDLGFAWFRMFGEGLREGWFKGHPWEVVQGGLGGVVKGLTNLREGKASAIKYVYRIGETEGVEKSRI
jgi:NADPH:quinone reductase